MPLPPFPAGVPSAPAAARRGPAYRTNYGRQRASGGPIRGPCPFAPVSGSHSTAARPTCLELSRPLPAETHRAFKLAVTSRFSRLLRLSPVRKTTLRSSIDVDPRRGFDNWCGFPERQISGIQQGTIPEILETRILVSRTPGKRWRWRCGALYAMHTAERRRERPRRCEVLVPLRGPSKHLAEPRSQESLRSPRVARTTAATLVSVLNSQYGD